jgi:hypothetical protein
MNNNNMTVNELRIGNYVSQNSFMGYVYSIESPLPRKEERFNDKALVTLFDNGLTTITINEIEPIILTDKWFEKWGFHKDGEYWSKGIFDYKYCFKYRDWANNWAFYQEYTDSPNSKDDGKKYPISFDIQYVHQLQNLWYSLLHEEIEQ